VCRLVALLNGSLVSCTSLVPASAVPRGHEQNCRCGSYHGDGKQRFSTALGVIEILDPLLIQSAKTRKPRHITIPFGGCGPYGHPPPGKHRSQCCLREGA